MMNLNKVWQYNSRECNKCPNTNKKDIQKNYNSIIRQDKIKKHIITIYQAKEHPEFRNKKSKF